MFETFSPASYFENSFKINVVATQPVRRVKIRPEARPGSGDGRGVSSLRIAAAVVDDRRRSFVRCDFLSSRP
ncbi:hypothetical protein [Jiella sonneratiae]|uniref:Uncharacterized protein n=1 Tax=Jiella sonneratiae TaxID=2816856 RepID=A0ABS3J2L2_9HYPH|nr:hypothetical protein [Jiella sonneratiae]MBO0903897.1 hypothetical protein [Jiella sonneratiae]